MPHLPSSRRQIQPPELFVRAALASWPKCEEKNGTTIIPLEFSPRQRALVVVPAKAQAPDRFAGRNFPPGQTAETLTSPRQADKCPPARWGYDTLAGIKPLPEGPGFRQCELSPCFPANIASASAWHRSPYGKIESAWKREGDTVRWNVTVPWNSRATVKLPGCQKIAVNGKSEDRSEFELPAGKWEITAQPPRTTGEPEHL